MSQLRNRVIRLEQRIPRRQRTQEELEREFMAPREQVHQFQQQEINKAKGLPLDTPVSDAEREAYSLQCRQHEINQAKGLPLDTPVTEAERKAFWIDELREAGFPELVEAVMEKR